MNTEKKANLMMAYFKDTSCYTNNHPDILKAHKTNVGKTVW